MTSTFPSTPFDYTDYIATALTTPGGHLRVGAGGFTLFYGAGVRLPGRETRTVKAACIAAGLPVIDTRSVPMAAMMAFIASSPLIAVGRDPDPEPWHTLSFGSLRAIAANYAAVGAEVWNLPGIANRPIPARRGKAS